MRFVLGVVACVRPNAVCVRLECKCSGVSDGAICFINGIAIGYQFKYRVVVVAGHILLPNADGEDVVRCGVTVGVLRVERAFCQKIGQLRVAEHRQTAVQGYVALQIQLAVRGIDRGLSAAATVVAALRGEVARNHQLAAGERDGREGGRVGSGVLVDLARALDAQCAAGDGQGNACFCFQLVTVHVQRERPSRRPAERDILGQILSQRYRRDRSVIRCCIQSGL